ncbi:MAG: alpha/beta hydrolase fold protein [Frankiales bacterium]|nr:alpha/beta hydrolase fold protein [Frankiales bacterium]
MADVTRHTQLVHGHEVRYAQAGTTGPVVALVHGIASRAAQWEQVMAILGDRFRVIAPDLLGHGMSAKPRGDYSLGAQACGIRDLLASLGHDRVSLVGHSLGGGIAMQFAYQFPERVERLALVSSGGLGREVSVFLRAATLPGSELVLPVIAGSWVRSAGRRLDQAVGRFVPAGLHEALVGFGSLGDASTRSAFVHTARSVIDISGQRVDGRDRLYLAADLPLLVVWGAKDAILPVAHGRALAEQLPSARYEEFPRSGHFPHLTEPRRLGELIADWLTTTVAAHLDPTILTERLRATGSAGRS